MKTRRARLVALGVGVSGLWSSGLVAPLRAQPSAGVVSGATVLEQLVGGWEGDGELMGRAAHFEMCWDQVLGGAFMRLRFANYFVSGTGRQRVLESVGFYPVREGAGAGTWADSRGVVFSLEVAQGPRSLTITWTGKEEAGRTVYELTSDSTMAVTDDVLTEGRYRAFARSELRRGAVAYCSTGG